MVENPWQLPSRTRILMLAILNALACHAVEDSVDRKKQKWHGIHYGIHFTLANKTHPVFHMQTYIYIYIKTYIYITYIYIHEWMKVKVSHQSCPTLWDLMNCSPPGSSVHGILQARILEWVGCHSLSPGDLPNPRIEPRSPSSLADSLPSKPPYIYGWRVPLFYDWFKSIKLKFFVFSWKQ